VKGIHGVVVKQCPLNVSVVRESVATNNQVVLPEVEAEQVEYGDDTDGDDQKPG